MLVLKRVHTVWFDTYLLDDLEEAHLLKEAGTALQKLNMELSVHLDLSC